MTVKDLKEFLSELDEDKPICVVLSGDAFIDLDKRHINQISRLNGYNGYIINGNMFWFKGIC